MIAPARLLVVDDEEVVCQSCRKIFERQGVHVETCTDAPEGLRLATTRHYSAVLLDLMMPEVSGLQLLEQLRALNPSVPVIIITGFSSIESAAQAMRLHAADYVPKPFTPEEIVDAVARVVPLPVRAAGVPDVRQVAGGAEPGPDAAAPQPVDAALEETRFCGRAWMRCDSERRVTAGVRLTSLERESLRGVRCVPVGERVYRGLPLAELTLAGGAVQVIPAPLSGEVTDCNEALLDDPRGALAQHGESSWIARVRPAHLEQDYRRAVRRREVLVSADERSAGEQVGPIEGLFAQSTAPLPTPAPASSLSPIISRLGIVNRHGERVALVCKGAALRRDMGLGRAVVERLRTAALPIEVVHGEAGVDTDSLREVMSRSDHVVFLLPQNMARIPGTIRHHIMHMERPGAALRARAASQTVVLRVLKIQAAAAAAPLALPSDTLAALADAVVAHMTAPRDKL